jgi:hypothetical protein
MSVSDKLSLGFLEVSRQQLCLCFLRVGEGIS